MSAAGTYYVYILASGRHGTLYIGVTNNIPLRLEQHRAGRGSNSSSNTACFTSSMWKNMCRRKKQSRARSN